MKLIKRGAEAREALLRGVEEIMECVAATLGPKGDNVALGRAWGAPMVVHDGVTVAREVEIEDPFENMGAQMVKEAASKTNDLAGDGTTGTVILTHAIATEASKNIVAGANSMILRKGIEKATDSIVESLEAMSIPIKSSQEINQVATISAQDTTIGTIVAKTVEKMGKDGVVTVEESMGSEIYVEYKDGMEFDRGFVSPYFMTDTVLQESTITDADILFTDRRITDMSDFKPFLDMYYDPNRVGTKNLVIIAGEMSGDPLSTLIINRAKGNIPSVLVTHAPSHTDRRKALMRDMAIIAGGTFISDDMGVGFSSLEMSHLGKASRVTSTKDSTIIVGGKGDQKLIADYVKGLENTKSKTASEFEKEQLEERIAKLTTGIAVINVGANSEIEMREKKERVIDAISATKAAMEEGVVPGGETALIRASEKLNEELIPSLEGDEKLGAQIISKAILYPFRRLMENAKYDSGKMLGELEQSLKTKNVGIDVMDGKSKDLVKAGIIDPVKVVKNALRNSVSVAIMIMTTPVLIVDKPKEERQEAISL